MPTSEKPAAPSVLPGLPLSAKQRERFEKETHSRLNQALTAFTDAAKSHAEALKAKAKADAEIAALTLDIFFGLSAPVFAGLVMAGGGRLKRAAEKISGVLSLGKNEAAKTVKLISESDFLKETFKAIGKIGTTAIKANAVALFGESEGDVFARHLRVSMHRGVQAITDRIGDMTDDELLATWAAYDFDFTNEEVYAETLKATFGAFDDLVAPIGKHVETTQYGSHGGEFKAVWMSIYGRRRLAVVDFMWAPKGLTGMERWRRFKGWVPQELEQYAIEKSKRKFGEVEEIDPATLEKAPPDPGDRPRTGPVLIDWGPRPRTPIRSSERRVPIRTSRDRVPISSGGSQPRIPIRSGGGP
jgi:hypothetical protein